MACFLLLYHNILSIKQTYTIFICFFHFAIIVNAGQTGIQRKSSESSVTIPDRETTKVLVQQVKAALEDKATWNVNKVNSDAFRFP